MVNLSKEQFWKAMTQIPKSEQECMNCYWDGKPDQCPHAYAKNTPDNHDNICYGKFPYGNSFWKPKDE